MKFSKGKFKVLLSLWRNKLSARTYSGLFDYDRVKTEPDFSPWYPEEGQEALKQIEIQEIPLKMEFFQVSRVVKHRKRLHIEIVLCPSLELLKPNWTQL